MKPIIIKNLKHIKKLNFGYFEEVSRFLSDEVIFNKKNVLNFYKQLCKKDITIKYGNLKFKAKKLSHADGYLKVYVYKNLISQELVVNKFNFDMYKNTNYAKSFMLLTLMHEIQHKKQIDSFLEFKNNNKKIKTEIDKYLYNDFLAQNNNPYYNALNPIPLKELLARTQTLNDYVDMIKKGIISPTLENLLAVLPHSLQVYSMQTFNYSNDVLLENNNYAEINNTFYTNYYLTKQQEFIKPMIQYSFSSVVKEVKEVNHDKFYFELQSVLNTFEKDIQFINNTLMTKYKLPIKYVQTATNLQYISKQYREQYLLTKKDMNYETTFKK